jgi:hypothetical protein
VKRKKKEWTISSKPAELVEMTPSSNFSSRKIFHFLFSSYFVSKSIFSIFAKKIEANYVDRFLNLKLLIRLASLVSCGNLVSSRKKRKAFFLSTGGSKKVSKRGREKKRVRERRERKERKEREKVRESERSRRERKGGGLTTWR